ncbi:hypothetical protein [uncultured Duncaniella sp.]|uniref:hypothetical protein n=3 Tax=uncultured Duncaniella sp. TaxID=2768039 RepID=UPI0025AFF0D8|nr:hypothetical protein [uncultured Duncaniella sp.]
MKKFLLFSAASAMAIAATAQTVIVPPTVADAQTAGYEALWGDYKYGYVLPNETQLVDNDAIKVVMNNASTAKPGANISMSGINTTLFDRSFQMGSAAGYGSADPIYALEALSEGIKQPYAIFTVEAKVGGELALFSNRGSNKYTMYVWDATVNEEVGAYVLASSSHITDTKTLISKATVGLTEGHKYYIFGSETGANINLYEIVYTPYSSEKYSVTEFDATKYSTAILPPSLDDAKAAGYEALWGDYKYGYVLPNETVVADSEDLKVVMNNASTAKPGANVSMSGINTTLFDRAFQMGSAAGYGSADPVYALEALSEGIKQPYAIFTVEAKKGGELTLFSNRGSNKYTIYVWDATVNEEVGAYVLASSSHITDTKTLISKATVGLTEGHKYYIFGSETGANINLYAMGYNNYSAPNYGYTADSETSGIADIIINEQPQSDVIYNVLGQKVDENYKGLVIKNGKKYIQR